MEYRLYHYELIPYLPDEVLLETIDTLFDVMGIKPSYYAINYVYNFELINLWYYTKLVTDEMCKRGLEISYWFRDKADRVFGKIYAGMKDVEAIKGTNPFPKCHTNRYLLQCFFILQERYERLKDSALDAETKRKNEDFMEKLVIFITGKFPESRLYDLIMFME